MNVITEVTVGNLLTLATVAVGGIIAWQRLTDRSYENRRRIENLEASCKELQDKLQSIEWQLAGIKADIAWICDIMRQERRGAPSRNSSHDNGTP